MRSATRSEYHGRIQEVVALAEANLNVRLSLEAMADHAGFSPFHFQRLFRSLVGESPSDLIRRFRLERAAGQLGQTDLRVGDIAFDAGYESHEAFSRAFRTAFGVPARTYRSQKLMATQLPSPVGLHFGTSSSFASLDHRSPAIDYRIADVPEFGFAGLKHRGSFQFAHRTWETLFAGLGEEKIDPMPHQWINMADELSDRVPVAEIRGLVGMDLAAEEMRPWMVRRRLGGGAYLVATEVGDGRGLVDFWFRLFFECLPHSGYVLRPGPLWQSTLGTDAVGAPGAFRTTVHIPVRRS